MKQHGKKAKWGLTRGFQSVKLTFTKTKHSSSQGENVIQMDSEMVKSEIQEGTEAALTPYLVLTSSLQRLTTRDSSTRTGSQPFTHVRSSTLTDSSVASSRNSSGLSASCRPQKSISRMASMDVSGNPGLHANSDRHLMASWKVSMVAAKCCSNIIATEHRKRHESNRQTIPSTLTKGGNWKGH